VLWRAVHTLFDDPSKAERYKAVPHPLLGMAAPVECAAQSDALLAQALAVLARLAQGMAV
jgi:hypothetical protein